jgi:tripartite-type tricarboxylate transporter receptor subunit TctC
MTSRRHVLALGASSLAAALLPLAAGAQASWPSRTVKIIVPYPAGGVNDVVARMLGERLRPLLGQSVVVDNRAGAGGTIGMDALVRADDGHTVAFAAISPLTLNPHITNVQYEPLKDVQAVASVMYAPVYVLATSRFAGSLQDAIARTRAQPRKVSIASSGFGTLGHIMIEQIRRKSGADLVHVPYKGGAQLITDAAGGQFDLLVANPFAPLNNLIDQGKLRVLALTGPRRLPNLPQVATLAQLGYPEANLTSLFGFYAPASMPPDVVRRLNADINKVLAEPQVQQQLRTLDNVPSTGTPQQFAAVIQQEHAANARIVKEANIKAE